MHWHDYQATLKTCGAWANALWQRADLVDGRTGFCKAADSVQKLLVPSMLVPGWPDSKSPARTARHLEYIPMCVRHDVILRHLTYAGTMIVGLMANPLEADVHKLPQHADRLSIVQSNLCIGQFVSHRLERSVLPGSIVVVHPTRPAKNRQHDDDARQVHDMQTMSSTHGT